MENIILTHLKKICIKSMILPLVFFLVSIPILVFIPIEDLIHPPKVENNEEIIAAYDDGIRFASITFDTLYYSNFDYYNGGEKIGSFYYSLSDDDCIFVLIPIEDDEESPQTIEDYSAIAKLSKNTDSLDSFFSDFASDINWTTDGLMEITASFIVDQVNYNTTIYYFLFILTVVIFFISLKFIISEIVYIRRPDCYPSFRKLKRFGISKNEYLNIENELQNELIIQIKSVYITKNYLIEFGLISMDVIPLKNIVWIYQFTHWGLTVKSHRQHTHNLCIYTDPYHRFILHRKSQNTVNDVINYFSENFPEVITEFSKEYHDRFTKK